MAARNPMPGSSPFMHGYQIPGRYMQGHQGIMPPMHAARHGVPMSSSHAHGMRSVQHGRVSDLAKKRLAEAKAKAAQQQKLKMRRRLGDKVLSQRIRDLVPESQAYMDLLAFERKLDSTIMRKRLEIQEVIRRPMRQKRKLRVFISHQFSTMEPEEADSSGVPQWELKIEGRLLDETGTKIDTRTKLKFSWFFKNVVVELDKEAYGPDNHLAEWHREANSEDIDGFTVTRPGEETVKCTILLSLNHQPVQYKLTSKLARLLGIHTATRPDIINAVWQYIKSNRLQDPQEREYINNDKYFQQILYENPVTGSSFSTAPRKNLFGRPWNEADMSMSVGGDSQIFEVPRMKFTEIPRRLQALLVPPDPIVVHHLINADAPEGKRTACYDIEVEVEDPLKAPMHSFLMSVTNQQDVASLDSKIHETVEQVNAIKLQREFYLGFADNPQKFINDWLASQSRDLKVMKDKMGNPEAERRASFYDQPWCDEAVPRYFYAKVNQRRTELEQALGIRHP